MQFTTILIALLPALAAAEHPSANDVCHANHRQSCAASSDGVRRCVLFDNGNLCVVDCRSQSDCDAQCKEQGHRHGFCTAGNNPCICTDVDPGFTQPTD